MTSKVLSGTADDVSDVEMLRSLLKSWFNRSRSTEPMIIGSRNEDAVLLSLSQKSYVDSIYDCGLLESNKLPWLAASPDSIVVVSGVIPNEQQLAVVEVKTRVSVEKIAEAERIAKKYGEKVIHCNCGDEAWLECIEKDHSNQIMCQVLVTGLKYCIYIVARPGTTGGKGKPIYMVFGTIEQNQFYAFLSYLNRKMDRILAPFYKSKNVDEVLAALPPGLSDIEQQIIRSRWPFFHKLRQSAIDCGKIGFPPTSLFKTSFQSLYNVIKGGLDANTQHYISIRPNVKITFEQESG